MRIDSDYKVFCNHFDWFETVPGVGYVPTEKCPPEAKKAMERFNKRHCAPNIKKQTKTP